VRICRGSLAGWQGQARIEQRPDGSFWATLLVAPEDYKGPAPAYLVKDRGDWAGECFILEDKSSEISIENIPTAQGRKSNV
jgi:hypothetical protein